MNHYFEPGDEGEGDFVRLTQYDDLIRRPTRAMSGELRLLWAVLADAIRAYLWSTRRATKSQRETFSELSDWFHPRSGRGGGLYSFRTICELLGIDPIQVIKSLGHVRLRDLPLLRHDHVARYTRLCRHAA